MIYNMTKKYNNVSSLSRSNSEMTNTETNSVFEHTQKCCGIEHDKEREKNSGMCLSDLVQFLDAVQETMCMTNNKIASFTGKQNC